MIVDEDARDFWEGNPDRLELWADMAGCEDFLLLRKHVTEMKHGIRLIPRDVELWLEGITHRKMSGAS